MAKSSYTNIAITARRYMTNNAKISLLSAVVLLFIMLKSSSHPARQSGRATHIRIEVCKCLLVAAFPASSLFLLVNKIIETAKNITPRINVYVIEEALVKNAGVEE